MSGYLRMDNAAVTELLTSPESIVGAELLRRTVRVHAAAVQGCPVHNGRLRSSIRFNLGRDERGLVGTVGTDVDYVLYVHEGTQPHEIRPRNMQALYWPGAAHPVAVVHHPGTRANPFLTNALGAAA